MEISIVNMAPEALFTTLHFLYNLLSLFVSYDENAVLWIGLQVPYSQHSIFFVTYKSAQKVRLFHTTKLKRLTSDKHSNLLGQSLSYE
jgi:hypothetical protein